MSIKSLVSASIQNRRKEIDKEVEKIQELLNNYDPDDYVSLLKLESCVEEIRRNHISIIAIECFSESYYSTRVLFWIINAVVGVFVIVALLKIFG